MHLWLDTSSNAPTNILNVSKRFYPKCIELIALKYMVISVFFLIDDRNSYHSNTNNGSSHN